MLEKGLTGLLLGVTTEFGRDYSKARVSRSRTQG